MDRVAVVLAGGDVVDPVTCARLPAGAYVVAADAGLHRAAALGLRVDCVVGDFDSADLAAVDAAERAGARIERHPADKDATDLELALASAVAWGAERIVVVGGAGGRVDHFLANVALLAHSRFAAVRIEALLGTARIDVVRGGLPATELDARAGDLVTLLPAAGAARGVTTKGLRFPLHGEDLLAGTSRGVSNVVAEVPASVALDRGTLLVVQPIGEL
jgi:thiamine pyrophosphokinase